MGYQSDILSILEIFISEFDRYLDINEIQMSLIELQLYLNSIYYG